MNHNTIKEWNNTTITNIIDTRVATISMPVQFRLGQLQWDSYSGSVGGLCHMKCVMALQAEPIETIFIAYITD